MTLKASLTLTSRKIASAATTRETPDAFTPHAGEGARLGGGKLQAMLPPQSWNVMRPSR